MTTAAAAALEPGQVVRLERGFVLVTEIEIEIADGGLWISWEHDGEYGCDFAGAAETFETQ